MIFSISPVNSLSFVKIDTNKPSFVNTLYQDQNRAGISVGTYCQKIQTTDVVTIQCKTDYTSVTAYMYQVDTGVITPLTATLMTSYASFSFWEIPITFSVTGFFKIFISATSTGFDNINYVSEMIEVRSSWDNVVIACWNLENTGEIDYSTGIRHAFRVFGILAFSDIGGKDEFYNNFGIQERIYSENETIYELDIENIPYYLCRQLIYCGRLDMFTINDVVFIVKEHSLTQHAGSHDFDLTMKVTEKAVMGISVYTGFGNAITMDSTQITMDNG
jgi:hypothetical protein